MLLIGVKEENGWLCSSWNLTYRVGWEQICKAVQSVYDFYHGIEILVDGNRIDCSHKEEIMNLSESRTMTVRGFSQIIKCPIMMTFYNQVQNVNVTLPSMWEEFKEADYQSFNLSLCQYMDSIELAMYR